MITKETLDQLEKEIDEHLENAKPGEMLSWLMKHRAKQFLIHNNKLLEEGKYLIGVDQMVEFLGDFAVQEHNKARRDISTMRISDLGINNWLNKPTDTYQGLLDTIESELSNHAEDLRNLADWFDNHDMKTLGHLDRNEVQLRLRAIAGRITKKE